MKRYEYKIAHIDLAGIVGRQIEFGELKAGMNGLGAEGWLLVHVHAGHIAIYVRELPGAGA